MSLFQNIVKGLNKVAQEKAPESEAAQKYSAAVRKYAVQDMQENQASRANTVINLSGADEYQKDMTLDKFGAIDQTQKDAFLQSLPASQRKSFVNAFAKTMDVKGERIMGVDASQNITRVAQAGIGELPVMPERQRGVEAAPEMSRAMVRAPSQEEFLKSKGVINEKGMVDLDKLQEFKDQIPEDVVKDLAKRYTSERGPEAFLRGAAKGAAETALIDLPATGEKILSAVTGVEPAVSIEENPLFNPEFFETKGAAEGIGKVTGDIALGLAGGQALAGPIAAKATSALLNAGKFVKTVDGAKKLTTGGRTLVNLLASAPQTAGFMAGAEGQLPTKGELGLGLAIDALAPGVADALGSLGNWTFSRLIKSTPTQKAKDVAKGLDLGQAVSKTGISASKKSLIGKLDNLIGDLGSKLDETIQKQIQKEITESGSAKTYDIVKIVDNVKDSILKDKSILKKMQLTPIEMSGAIQTIDEVADAYKTLYANNVVDLAGLQEIKVAIGQGLKNYYDKAIDAKLRVADVTEGAIRKDIKNVIEEVLPESKKINRALAPLLEASGRLKKKGSYSGYLTDIIVGSMTASAGGVGILEDPQAWVKNFLSGVVLKRAGTSTLSKTTAATIAKDIEKLFNSQEFIKAFAFSALPKALEESELELFSDEEISEGAAGRKELIDALSGQ